MSSRELFGVTDELSSGEPLVRREEELALIGEMINQARYRAIPDNPRYPQHLAIYLTAIPGQGKTILAHQIADRYAYPGPTDPDNVRRGHQRWTASAFVDLPDRSDSVPTEAISVLNKVAAQLEDQLKPGGLDFNLFQLEAEAGWEEINEAAAGLVRWVYDRANQGLPVFVFDGAERLFPDDEFLDWFQDHFVSPLINYPRAFLVFAGRKEVPWPQYYVRDRFCSFSLPPFDSQSAEFGGDHGIKEKNQAREILTPAKEKFPQVSEAWLNSYAYGHPLTSRVVVETLQSLPASADLEDRRVQIVLADAIWEQVIKGCFFSEFSEQERTLLVPLCFVRDDGPGTLALYEKALNEIQKRNLVNSSEPLSFRSLDEERTADHALWAKRAISQVGLARYDHAGRVAMDKTARQIASRCLAVLRPDKFRLFHQVALEMNNYFLKEYPGNAGYILPELCFHRFWFSIASQVEANLFELEIRDNFNRNLAKLAQMPDISWDLGDILSSLKENLNQDEELRGLFSRETYSYFLARVQRVF
ncbi:hypothetical protein ACFLZP_03645 [Patescibacteria group bacterium]